MTPRTGLSVPEGYGVAYDDAVEIARDAGCAFAEVLFDGRAHPETVAAELGPALDGVEMGLVAHLPFTVPVWSPFDAHSVGARRTHEACIEAAASLGADAAVVHPSGSAMRDAYDDADIVTGVVESVRELHAFGAERGVAVCVENLQTGPFTLDGMTKILDETAARLVIDTGHARVSGHEMAELVEFVTRERDRIAHVHLNDTRGASDEHLPLGAGSVDFRALLAALGDDWSGRLCVEAMVGDRTYLEQSLATLDKLLAADGVA